MNLPRIRNHVAQLRQQTVRNARRLDERTQGRLGMVTSAAQATLRPESGIMAAAIAYYALLSLFPLTLLSIAIASFSFGPEVKQPAIIRNLEFVAPALGQLLGENIDAIIEARGPVTAVALVSLIWSASTVFHTLTLSLNDMWEIRRRRAVWKRRGLAVLFVLAVAGPTLFLASFASSMIANLRPRLPDALIPIGNGVSLALALLLDVGLFMVLYMLLPRGASTWRDILPGAIGAGVLWELAKKAFLAFVATYITVSNLVYGSVAAVIAFLVWAYLTGLVFLFGAYVSVAHYRLTQQQREAATSESPAHPANRPVSPALGPREVP